MKDIINKIVNLPDGIYKVKTKRTLFFWQSNTFYLTIGRDEEENKLNLFTSSHIDRHVNLNNIPCVLAVVDLTDYSTDFIASEVSGEMMPIMEESERRNLIKKLDKFFSNISNLVMLDKLKNVNS